MTVGLVQIYCLVFSVTTPLLGAFSSRTLPMGARGLQQSAPKHHTPGGKGMGAVQVRAESDTSKSRIVDKRLGNVDTSSSVSKPPDLFNLTVPEVGASRKVCLGKSVTSPNES